MTPRRLVSVLAALVLIPGAISASAALAADEPRVSARSAPASAEFTAFGWGYNGYGELGYGSTSAPYDDSAPGAVLGGDNASGKWASITSWGYSSCGVAPDGSGYCWGGGSSGQLGTGNEDDTDRPAAIVEGADGPTSWASVEAGYDYACGVGTNAKAYCWGYNDNGRLGNGTVGSYDDSLPVAVLQGANSSGQWASVSAGEEGTTCGLDLLGHAFCWGANGNGQLGNGTTGTYDDSLPVAVLAGANSSGTYSSLSVGRFHACGMGPDGKAYCWGGGGNGELGDGTYDDTDVPVAVLTGNGLPDTWKSVSAAQSFTCGIGGDDSAYCWGYNAEGQLGPDVPAGDYRNVPVRIPIPGDVPVKTLSPGADSVCVTTADSVYCWGDNSYGQLGIGSVESWPSGVHPEPQLVDATPFGSLSPASVSLGYVSSFALFGSAPTLQSLSPTSGPTAGGTSVTVTGTALAGATSVTFGSGSGIITARTSTTVTATTPAGTAGAVDVSVTTPTGTATLQGAFTYSDADPNPPSPGVLIAPSAPLGVAATAGDARATITWRAPADPGTFPVSAYQVTLTPASPGCLVTAPALTCEVSGLTNGTSYTFTVRALNGAGWGAPSAPTDPVTPTAASTRPGKVTGLRVTTVTRGQVTLRWQAPASDGGAPITGYRVWARTTTKKGWVAVTPDPKDTSATVANLRPGASYWFKVAATNSIGRGPVVKTDQPVRIPRR